jgi:putative ABC transport system permease protein
MFNTTIKGLLAHKVRLITTLVSIIAGVALMAGTLVLTDTVGRTFDDLYADINRGTDVVVRSATNVGGADRAPLTEDLLTSVRDTDGVAAAGGVVDGYAQFMGPDGTPLDDPGLGAPARGTNWPAPGVPNPFILVAGSSPAGADQVVMDQGSADRGGFAVGDTVRVLTKAAPRDMTVAGVARFGTLDSPAGSSVALFDTATAQQLIGVPGMFSSIVVAAGSGVSPDELAMKLTASLPAGIEAVTGEVVTAEQRSSMRDNLSFLTTFLVVFALVALFVGSFIIANTYSIMVAQRRGELAMLRALGASRGQVRAMVLVEAAIVGALASVLGLAAGVAMASGLSALLAVVGLQVPAGEPVVTGRTIVVALSAGFVVTVASAFLPARRAASVPPIAALRQVAVDTSAGSRLRLLAGAAVVSTGTAALAAGLAGAGVAAVGVGAAMVLIGVAIVGPVIVRPASAVLGAPLARLRGTPGRLAQANAMRNPARTSSTAAALMIGVALVGAVTVLTASVKASVDEVIEASFLSDLMVDTGLQGAGGLSPVLAEELRRQPEVASATSDRMAPVEIDGVGHLVTAVDPALVHTAVDLQVVSGSLAGLDTTGIAVSEDTATDGGIAVGDTVTARFVTGDRDLKVTAVYRNADIVGAYLIGFPLHEQVVSDVVDLRVFVTLRPGVTPQAGRAAIERVAGVYPTAKVRDLAEVKAANSAPIDQVLTLVYALLALAVVIALAGIGNTVALAVRERTRELGLLRAVGMSRAQLRAAVRWEALIIALFGTVIGLGVGLLFGWAIVQALSSEGFNQLRVPVGQLSAVTGLAGLAGVAAAVLPARRAARLDVLTAIATQ